MRKASKKVINFSMNSNFSFNSKGNGKDKKGMIALDSLIGVILSVIALFFVVQFIFNIFLNTPQNLKIAKSNAQSIADFVDYSYEKYNTYENCYLMLKLINLENFQFDEGDPNKNYFYVIGKNKNKAGVFIIPLSYLGDFEKNKNLEGIRDVGFVAFKSEGVILKYDDTSDNSFTLSLWGNNLNSLSKNLDLKSNINYIYLVPKLNENIWFVEINWVDDDDNVLIGKSIIDSDLEFFKGNYLGFSPSNKDLFLSKSVYSNTLLKYKSCSMKYNLDFDYAGYIKENPEKADFMNYELVFDLINKDNNEKMGTEFIWKGGEISCPDKTGRKCEDYLGEKYLNLNYEDFYNKLIQDVSSHEDFKLLPGGSYRFELIRIRKLSLDEIKKIQKQKNLNYDYDQIFIKFDIDHLESNNNIEDVLDAKFGDGNVFHGFLNRRIDKSNCKQDACDFVGFQGQVPYFYDYSLKSFVSFNTKLLRVDKDKSVYFLGDKLVNNEESFDPVGWFNWANSNFYLFEIETKNGKRTIILSEFLINEMLERENYKSIIQSTQERLGVPDTEDGEAA